MNIREAVKEYCASQYNLSPRTRTNNKLELGVFISWCEQEGLTLEGLTTRHIRMYLEVIAQRPGMQDGYLFKSSTVRRHGISAKAFLRWCTCDEEFEELVSPKLASRVELPKVEETVIEVFSSEQIEALFEACEKQPYPVRDRALLAVMFDTGARASEVVGLTLECVA